MTPFTPDDLRIIAHGHTVWLRILRTREENLIARMCADFRNGKTDHLAAVAELASLRGQVHEIETAVRTLQNVKQKE